MADISKIKLPDGVTYNVKDANAIKGSGTSGCIAKFDGTNTVTNGPAFGSDMTKYLRNDGTWATPTDRNNMVQQYVLPAPSVTKTFPLIIAYSGVTDPDYDSTETNYVRKQLGLEFDPKDKKLYLSYDIDRCIIVSGREISFRGGNTRIGESSVLTGSIYTENDIYSEGDIETETNLIGNKVTCNSISANSVTLPHQYSTDEQIVGYWVNGNPIYEKTVVLSSAKSLSPNANTTIMSWPGGTIYPISFKGYRTSSNPIAWEGISASYQNGNLVGVSSRDTAITLEFFTIQYRKA